LPRIWEGDEESDCRYSEDESAMLNCDEVSSESSLDDDLD